MIAFSVTVGLSLIGSDFSDILDLSDIKEISTCHFEWDNILDDGEYKELLFIKEYIETSQ